MPLVDLPIDSIRIPDVRLTSRMPADLAEQFRSSVATAGVLEPLHVVQVGDQYVLVNGLHRLQEAQARGDGTIPCVVVPGTLQDVLLRNLQTSGLQGRPPASEVRQVLRVLEEEQGLDLRAIRRLTGLTEGYLSNLLWVNRAVPQVQEALDAEEIPLGAAVALARVDNTELQGRLLEVYLRHRPTVSQFEQVCRDAARQLADAPGAGELANLALLPPLPAGASCGNCGGDTPVNRLTYVALCPRCMAYVYEAERTRAPSAPP